MTDNAVALGSGALLATLGIQYLKNSGWATWFNRDTDKANLGLSVLIASATSLGIHYTCNANGDCVVTGNWHLIGNAVVQWATQHAAYKGFVVPSEALGEIRALLQRLLQPPISSSEQKTSDAKDRV